MDFFIIAWMLGLFSGSSNRRCECAEEKSQDTTFRSEPRDNGRKIFVQTDDPVAMVKEMNRKWQ